MTCLESSRRVRANGRNLARTMTILAVIAGVTGAAAASADGRPAPRGGGISRPAGGGMKGGFQRPNRSSMPQIGANRPQLGTGQAAERPSGQNRAAMTSASGSGNRSTATANSSRTANVSANRTANGNSQYARNGNNGAVGTANTNTGTVGSGNSNSGVVNNGTVGSGNVNTGNVVAGNDVNVDVNNGWGAYPAGTAYATGVAVGTTASAAVARSYYYSLPPSCSPYVWNSVSYYSCAGIWYQSQSQSGQTVYVVVSDPTKAK